jgi:hypothetical protein
MQQIITIKLGLYSSIGAICLGCNGKERKCLEQEVFGQKREGRKMVQVSVSGAGIAE